MNFPQFQSVRLRRSLGSINWPASWPILYLWVVTGTIFAASFHWAYDDPFITYRYAQNLAHGLGFVYNPGERILSTTTPLFTFLLAAFSPLWSDLFHLANLMGALSLALGGVFIWNLAHSWNTPLVGWIGLLLYPAHPLLLATLGSEMPLYLAFCLGAFAFYARQHFYTAALCAALATLTRPDGLLIFALLTAEFLVRKRRQIPWTALLLFLSLTLPWFLFAWAYFGSPLPITLAAKQHQGMMVINLRFAPRFPTIISAYARYWYRLLEVVLAFLGVVSLIWQSRRWALFLAWTVLYFAAYTVLGVSGYSWYYAPLVPGFVAAVGLGCSIVWDTKFFSRLKSGHQPALFHRSPMLLTTLLIMPLIFGQARDLGMFWGQSDPRLAIYSSAGKWLRDNTPEEANVGALEVGILGYFAQRPMIDFAGLLQPETAKKMGPNSTYADTAHWVVEEYRPEYLVLQVGLFPELEQGYAAQHCHAIQHFPGDPHGYQDDLRVYQCNL